MSEVAIKVAGLSKLYKIGAKKSDSLRETLVDKWNQLTGNKSTAEEDFWALQDVSFEIKKGEAVGIIGRNGAGKSTLLKVLSRITEPTRGRVEMDGRVASLLEVGTGFHPELSGRENVFLNGTILGMSRREIRNKFDEIVAFSGVEKFIDTPVKYYSSGMYVRLAFAVAAHLDSEILIIDEVLAVGDAEFQKKCLGKMGEVAGQGRTVLFVSHDMQAISTLVSQCLYMSRGTLVASGPKNKIIDQYISDAYVKQALAYRDSPAGDRPKITSIELHTSKPNNFHINTQPLKVSVGIYLPHHVRKTCITLCVKDNRGVACLDFSYFDNHDACSSAGVYQLTCEFPSLRLYMGKYTITAYFAEPPGGDFFQTIEHVCPFEVSMLGTSRGEWEWQPHTSVYTEDYKWKVAARERSLEHSFK